MIKLLRMLLSISLFCCCGVISLNPSPVKGETVLEEISRTGVLKVAVRNDAIPFGYLDHSQLQGLCLNLVQLIREEIIRRGDRTIISINLIVSSLDNRFSLVQDQLVHLECGPNSIRSLPDYDQVTFSQPFFISGIQLISKSSQTASILNPQNTNLTIGVLANTNTETFIREKFSQAQIQIFSGSRGNLRGIQSVNRGSIDAFANDGILLLGEAIFNNIPLHDNSPLTIIPEIPLTCERYGLILPKDDHWINLVNTVLNSDGFRTIRRDWFISLAEESLLPRQQCN